MPDVKEKVCLLLVGLPGSGKSTFVKNFLEVVDTYWVVISSDNHIEAYAKEQGKTYNEVFIHASKFCTQKMWDDVDIAVDTGANILWDQTNLTKDTRKQKLRRIPEDYRIRVVYFPVPEETEWQRRLNRPGKIIPEAVLKNMSTSLEIPSLDEERIEKVITWGQ